MKNYAKLIGIIVIAAIIVFSMGGCSNGSTTPPPKGPPGKPVTPPANPPVTPPVDPPVTPPVDPPSPPPPPAPKTLDGTWISTTTIMAPADWADYYFKLSAENGSFTISMAKTQDAEVWKPVYTGSYTKGGGSPVSGTIDTVYREYYGGGNGPVNWVDIPYFHSYLWPETVTFTIEDDQCSVDTGDVSKNMIFVEQK